MASHACETAVGPREFLGCCGSSLATHVVGPLSGEGSLRYSARLANVQCIVPVTRARGTCKMEAGIFHSDLWSAYVTILQGYLEYEVKATKRATKTLVSVHNYKIA